MYFNLATVVYKTSYCNWISNHDPLLIAEYIYVDNFFYFLFNSIDSLNRGKSGFCALEINVMLVYEATKYQENFWDELLRFFFIHIFILFVMECSKEGYYGQTRVLRLLNRRRPWPMWGPP